eukprot:TRINITY_DN490_c0_g1_i2.p1 TRINITY_DN490_c0_g1~~TRINITY_DN490_c0_g1_i2.p1  ORF type:complete len:474 (+),score=106.19 TRINITY_DN490_c0_g1_i2:563-1984(+)
MRVYENEQLFNFEGLESIESIGGNMEVYGNEQLFNFEGLESIESIGGNMEVYGNEQLFNFEGLESLKSVFGYINVYENANLTSYIGLNNLQTVGGDFSIQNVSGSNNTYFNSLAYIGGVLILCGDNECCGVWEGFSIYETSCALIDPCSVDNSTCEYGTCLVSGPNRNECVDSHGDCFGTYYNYTCLDCIEGFKGVLCDQTDTIASTIATEYTITSSSNVEYTDSSSSTTVTLSISSSFEESIDESSEVAEEENDDIYVENEELYLDQHTNISKLVINNGTLTVQNVELKIESITSYGSIVNFDQSRLVVVESYTLISSELSLVDSTLNINGDFIVNDTQIELSGSYIVIQGCLKLEGNSEITIDVSQYQSEDHILEYTCLVGDEEKLLMDYKNTPTACTPDYDLEGSALSIIIICDGSNYWWIVVIVGSVVVVSMVAITYVYRKRMKKAFRRLRTINYNEDESDVELSLKDD